MGETAAQSIVKERETNGPYKDIYDFAERVDYSCVNRKAFESLALSGGFDGFEFRREQYFAAGMKGDVFLDTLVRYGQLYQQEQRETKNSLFGGESAVEISRPVPGNAEDWSTIERLNRERDLVGIYLSAHPLDEYGVILKSMCNTHCVEIDKKEELAKKEEISIGGIVTGVNISQPSANNAIATVASTTSVCRIFSTCRPLRIRVWRRLPYLLTVQYLQKTLSTTSAR